MNKLTIAPVDYKVSAAEIRSGTEYAVCQVLCSINREAVNRATLFHHHDGAVSEPFGPI